MAFLFRNARAWGSRMREVTLLVKGPNRSYCLKVPDDIAMEQLRAKVRHRLLRQRLLSWRQAVGLPPSI